MPQHKEVGFVRRPELIDFSDFKPRVHDAEIVQATPVNRPIATREQPKVIETFDNRPIQPTPGRSYSYKYTESYQYIEYHGEIEREVEEVEEKDDHWDIIGKFIICLIFGLILFHVFQYH